MSIITKPPDDVYGIHPSDIIIRSAIIDGLEDLRKNPWLLDYVFAALPKDAATSKKYGDKDIAAAKSWFLKTEIPVSISPRLDEGRWPRISIELASSVEAENTLSDLHYSPVEILSIPNNPLTSPFTPLYDSQAGKITLPASVLEELYPVAGQKIVDKTGNEHDILSVDGLDLFVKPNLILDLRDAVIKGSLPTTAVHMESANFRETYQIGVFVGSEAVYLSWLHSIVVFILLRYRETLLEGRGFERSSFTSSDFMRDESFGQEIVYARFITINGVVRQYWPKAVESLVSNVRFDKLKVIGGDNLPEIDPNDALWVGDKD